MLTTKEQYVMLAISRGGRRSYALSIQDEIKVHGHSLTLGVLYTVLGRLERRGQPSQDLERRACQTRLQFDRKKRIATRFRAA